MDCIKTFKGVLIQFDRPEQHQEFKEFKARHRMGCWLWNEHWNPDPNARKQNVVVVDIKY